MNNKVDWRVLVVAIAGLVVIECFAMCFGINGTLRTIIVAAICLIAGIAIPKEKFITA